MRCVSNIWCLAKIFAAYVLGKDAASLAEICMQHVEPRSADLLARAVGYHRGEICAFCNVRGSRILHPLSENGLSLIAVSIQLDLMAKQHLQAKASLLLDALSKWSA